MDEGNYSVSWGGWTSRNVSCSYGRGLWNVIGSVVIRFLPQEFPLINRLALDREASGTNYLVVEEGRVFVCVYGWDVISSKLKIGSCLRISAVRFFGSFVHHGGGEEEDRIL